MNEKNLGSDNVLSDSIKRINLLEKEELAQLGQNVDDEGNILIPEKKNRKTRRFKLLIALAFVGASIWVNYDLDSHQDKDLNEDKIVDVVEVEEDSKTESNSIDEASDVSSPEGRLADFSNRYDFQQIETDEFSEDHVENLANDEYATNFLLGRAFLDMETRQALVDSQDINVNLSEVMTDMYFRRDDLGNPILGVYFNPDVISNAIQHSDSKYFNLSFPVGWSEYNVTLSERRFPELYSYQINGQEVFSRNANLSTETNETGEEILLENSYEVIDILEMSDQERANFLVEEVESWSEEEFDFLTSIGEIEDEDGYWDDIDAVYYNDSSRFKYGPGQTREGEPRRNGFNTIFNIPIITQAEVLTSEQAEQIRVSGEIITFDDPRNRQTTSYQDSAIFYPNGVEFPALQNQELLFELARSNPDAVIVASAGDIGSKINADSQPNNLITAAIYARGMSAEGANVYLNFNEDEGIINGDTASAYITNILSAEDPEDPGEFLLANSSATEVWRGEGEDSYEEEILVLSR
jgi:hypothetical protein